ncbi:hypothetical protein CBS101457_006934 [Exobasidium rhododendri]|nr:hypothetical protein CBS101457_006934 [Exobasidium rhododendri]
MARPAFQDSGSDNGGTLQRSARKARLGKYLFLPPLFLLTAHQIHHTGTAPPEMWHWVTSRSSLGRISWNSNYELLLSDHRPPPKRRKAGNIVVLAAISFFLIVSILFSIGPVVTDLYGYARPNQGGKVVSLLTQCALPTARDRFICKYESSKREFESWQRTQSRTPEEAVRKYRLRYHREPPPGFIDWVKLALHHNSTLIDEYDQLESDLLPHRLLGGPELRQRLEGASAVRRKYFISLLQVHNNTITYERQKEPNFRDVITSLRRVDLPLPDLKIMLNWDDGPLSRVGTPPTSMDMHSEEFLITTSLPWLTATCPASMHPLRESTHSIFKPSMDLCTLRNNTSEKDKEKHGLFLNRGNAFPYTVPILSTARFSTSADILYPHVVYSQGGYHQVDTIPFEEKTNSLYWRGSNSGQTFSMQNWNIGHRPRFVLKMLAWKKLSSGLERGLLSVDEASRTREAAADQSLSREAIQSLANLHGSTFDVAFSGMTNCFEDPKPCEKLASVAPLVNWTNPRQSLSHKFLFDLDGNGMSGRFYRLLESNSVVFKQTMFAEWHDDRLVPWLHYIPVDLDFTDMPQLLDFFSNDARGKEIAADIARQSGDWAKKSLQPIDMSLYYHRLLIEYAAMYNAP